jgi:hypothetical protein
MMNKAAFIDRFVMECSGRNGSGADITSTTFLRTIMPGNDLAELAERLSRAVRLPVSRRELQFFIDSANYNVADLYDYLVDRQEARKSSRKYQFGKVLLVVSVAATVLSLFMVQIPLCFLSMGVGSGVYKYMMSSSGHF